MGSSYFQELSPPHRPLCIIGEGGWGERKRKRAVRLQNSPVFFLKISKEIGKAWRTEAREPHTAYLTAHAYLNTQKYGLFCRRLART